MCIEQKCHFSGKDKKRPHKLLYASKPSSDNSVALKRRTTVVIKTKTPETNWNLPIVHLQTEHKKKKKEKNRKDNEEHIKRKPARLCDISDRWLPRRPVAISEKRTDRLRLQSVQQNWILIIRARATDTSAKRAEVTTTRSEVNLSMHKSTGTIYHNKDREKVLERHLCLFP